VALGGLAGAGAGGFVGSRRVGGGISKPIGGGGFVAPKSPSNNFGMVSKPTTTNWGSNNVGYGNSGFGNTGQKSSGSSLLKVAGAGAGGGLLGGVLGKGSRSGGLGGSEFGSSSGFGSSSSGFGNLGKSSARSNVMKMAGVGVGGALLGGALSKGFKRNPYGVSQYSGYKKPKRSFGSYLFGGGRKSYGYKTPGYGTNWGTNFAGGMGQYKKPKTGISKKALGLGIGAGFLGGAALGVAGTMATYSVYHKYQEFKRMMYMNSMGMMNPGMGMGMGMDMDNMGMGMGNPGMNMGMGNQGIGMGNQGMSLGTGIGLGMAGMGVGMMARGWDNDYYNNNYLTNTCIGGCPINSHCEWGLCECNAGTTRRYGRCEKNWPANPPPRPQNFDPFQTCSNSQTCQALDMNLICNTNLTTEGSIGKCECRRDMKWNTGEGECQLFLDVDCSSITYETQPSAAILAAVDRANTAMSTLDVPPGAMGEDEVRTESKEETLQRSLLSYMGNTSSENDLREAFCRDIDAYSFEFQQQPQVLQPAPPQVVVPSPTLQPSPPPAPVPIYGHGQWRDEKPEKCDVVPQSACALAYDSDDCDGGWKLVIPIGELRFRMFTSWYMYRNDMDTVGIRAGCTLTAYSDSDFSGNRIDITAENQDRWVVFGEHAEYLHMASDIESLRCVCKY